MTHRYRSIHLSRSGQDKKLAGVCGGIAQYYGHSSTLIRVVALLSFLCLPVAVLIAYSVAALVMPTR